MIIDRDTPAVFVVGCPRSGTTLLQEILNRHPDLAIGPETHFFSHFRRHLLRRQYRLLYRFLWSDNLRRKLDRRLMPRHRVGDQLLARIDERRVLEAFADFPCFVETGMPLSAVTSIPVEGLEPAFARVFARWLGAQGVEGGARVIGEKTPIHVMHMHEIQSIFPSARFVHIVRDAHATIASLKKMHWASHRAEVNARLWKRCSSPPRDGIRWYFKIAFEDLIQDPRSTMLTVCEFLEIDFVEEMLAPKELDSSDKYVAAGEPWKRHSTRPVSSHYVQSRPSDLTEEELAMINAVLNEEP